MKSSFWKAWKVSQVGILHVSVYQSACSRNRWLQCNITKTTMPILFQSGGGGLCYNLAHAFAIRRRRMFLLGSEFSWWAASWECIVSLPVCSVCLGFVTNCSTASCKWSHMCFQKEQEAVYKAWKVPHSWCAFCECMSVCLYCLFICATDCSAMSCKWPYMEEEGVCQGSKSLCSCHVSCKCVTIVIVTTCLSIAVCSCYWPPLQYYQKWSCLLEQRGEWQCSTSCEKFL